MPHQPRKSTSASLKLQKVLADLGLASRRKAEQWIADGRVQVDGEIATLGTRVTQDQTVALDGKELRTASARRVLPRLLLMNKKVGSEVSNKPGHDRPSVFEQLPKLKQGRWISVGRLDVSTSGLLLFSNSGELVNRLMHPSTEIDREYAVRINALLDDQSEARLMSGVRVDGEVLNFSDIRHYDGSGTNHWYHVCLLQGRNREIRRLFESQHILVSRLKRVRYGPVFLPSVVPSGRTMEVHPDEVHALCNMVGLKMPKPNRRKPDSGKRKSVLLPYPNLTLPQWSKGNKLD